MLTIAAALLAAGQPIPPARDPARWVFATIDHSEWCPAGHVRLDLRTGRYEQVYTAARQVCSDLNLQRPVRTGQLTRPMLTVMRAAFDRVATEGVRREDCRGGDVVISNGGRRVLVATSGSRTMSAPDERGCWTPAATDFHRMLESAFEQPRRGR